MSPGPLPRRFWVTDDRRQPDPLPRLATLPAGTGVLFRHYGLAPAARARLAWAVAARCRQRHLRLWVAADAALARAVGAEGLHLPEGLARCPTPAVRRWRGRLTVAAHDRAALARAAALGADAALLSPVFPTLSHPGAPGLGWGRFARLARAAPLPVIALGGMDAARFRRLAPLPTVVGWAGVSGAPDNGSVSIRVTL